MRLIVITRFESTKVSSSSSTKQVPSKTSHGPPPVFHWLSQKFTVRPAKQNTVWNAEYTAKYLNTYYAKQDALWNKFKKYYIIVSVYVILKCVFCLQHLRWTVKMIICYSDHSIEQFQSVPNSYCIHSK